MTTMNTTSILRGSAVILLLSVPVSGCNNMAKGAAIGGGAGAAVGAGVGAAIGRDAKSAAIGALIGAAVGGTAGAIIGNDMDRRAEQMRKDLENARVERVGEGILVTFDSGILFDVGRADLREAAKSNIQELTEVLKRYDDTDVLVVGHTDSTGDEAFNLELSRERAEAVAGWATSHGLDADRIRIEGQGEAAPVADNATAEGRQQNRRVEIAIFANEKMKKAVEDRAG